MKVSVYGAGYVGLVTGVCLASLGHEVICLDIDKEKITLLAQGISPIYEKGLTELLKQQRKEQRIQFTIDYELAVSQGDVHIIAAGTPSQPNGSADMRYVHAVAKSIAQAANKNLIIVNKSTVPVGSGDEVESLIKQVLEENDKPFAVTVASNPEFLREGVAVNDFINADRVIIGCDDSNAEEVLRALYQPLSNKGVPLLCMSRRSAELSKYAANAMLATKISFINEMSQIAEVVGGNIDEISQAIGLDHRIGPHYNQAGCGYGGSCFPKDVRALINTAYSNKITPDLIKAVESVNIKQRQWLISAINNCLPTLKDKTIGIWGLAFKPDTDDIREASSLVLIEYLLGQGAQVVAYDPVASDNVKAYFVNQQNLSFVSTSEQVLSKIDALAIVTEWDEFKSFNLNTLSAHLNSKPILDGRNLYSLACASKHDLNYYSVGRPRANKKLPSIKGEKE